MILTKIACPHCGALLKSTAGVQVGKRIVCPKCGEPFAAAAPDVAKKTLPPGDLEGERLPAGRSSARSTKHIAQPHDDDMKIEEQDEGAERHDGVEIRPRKKKGKKRKQRAAPSLLLPGLLIGGAILLLAGGGIGFYLLVGKRPAVNTSPAASKSSNSSDVTASNAADVPAGWREVISAQGRFRAVMPQPVVERTRTMASPAGPVTDTQYLRETDGKNLGYSITFAEFSPTQVAKVSLEKIIDAGRDAMLKQYAGKLEADRETERDGRRGREVIISVPGRGRFLMHYYIDGSRLYTLTVAGSTAALDSKEVQAFFDSFHFTDAKP
jgi:hypothetical protein